MRAAVAGGVTTLVLNRPEKRNALSAELVEAMVGRSVPGLACLRQPPGLSPFDRYDVDVLRFLEGRTNKRHVPTIRRKYRGRVPIARNRGRSQHATSTRLGVKQHDRDLVDVTVAAVQIDAGRGLKRSWAKL